MADIPEFIKQYARGILAEDDLYGQSDKERLKVVREDILRSIEHYKKLKERIQRREKDKKELKEWLLGIGCQLDENIEE